MITCKQGFDYLEDAFSVYMQVFQPTKEEIINNGDYPEKWLVKLGENGLVLVAYDGELPVGFAACYVKPESLHIWNVGVLPNHRGKGIWKQLHANIESFAKDNGYNKLTLNTYKEKWRAMYISMEQLGFSLVEELDTKSRFEKQL